ncbi:MAG: hypothetical protein UV65_C0021G0004 [Parcubacteria group bacterium GW2011_GWF2_43_11]|nr:MAG: hypothetical protein UV65_C0021G0004 [Parcubacteria group bacterium GW2011_GWF2_43_11]
MSKLGELTKIIDETEFSDRVKDKVKEISVKAKLRKESGKSDEECLTKDETNELMQLIKADMILDGLRAKACRAYLDEIDGILNKLIR